VFVDDCHRDPDRALTLARIVRASPTLSTCRIEHQHSWRHLLAAALAERSGREETVLRDEVLAAAAVDCLELAADRWTAANGEPDLASLVDEAFAVLRPN
jgi:hypothetical protein